MKMMNSRMILFFLGVFVTTNSIVLASDPNPLQDFCIGDINDPGAVRMNGYACKNPADAVVDDFYFTGILTPRSTDNPVGSNITSVNVETFPGLNTLGISMGRSDFAPGGWNPPHVHPRATELLLVLEGTILVEFASSNQNGNRLFSKVLNKGDMFLIPQGMAHFQMNVGPDNAVGISSFSSQFPGVYTIDTSVFKFSTRKIPTHDLISNPSQD